MIVLHFNMKRRIENLIFNFETKVNFKIKVQDLQTGLTSLSSRIGQQWSSSSSLNGEGGVWKVTAPAWQLQSDWMQAIVAVCKSYGATQACNTHSPAPRVNPHSGALYLSAVLQLLGICILREESCVIRIMVKHYLNVYFQSCLR